jgi:hypothetical protein
VAQIVRIRCHIQEVRQGKVIKETDDVRFAATSYWPQETGPQQLLDLARDHWSIENGQHYRRDRTPRLRPKSRIEKWQRALNRLISHRHGTE